MKKGKMFIALLITCVICMLSVPAFADDTVTINCWHHYSAQSAENET